MQVYSSSSCLHRSIHSRVFYNGEQSSSRQCLYSRLCSIAYCERLKGVMTSYNWVCTSYLDAKVARISMRCWYLGVRNVFPVGSCSFPIFGVVCVEAHRAFNPEKSYFIFAQNPLIYTFPHQNYYMYHLNVKKRKILPGFSLLYFGEFFRGKYTTGNAEQLWKLICSGNYAMCYLSRGDCWRLIQVLLEVCTHARFKFRSLTSSD